MTDLAIREIPILDILTDMPVPLYVTPQGAVRVNGTRVSLDTVVYHFNQGRRPEEIVDSFDTLDLADVYGVIFYYLRHRAEIDEYLRQLDESFEARRREEQAKPEYQAWVDRLRERQAAIQREKQQNGDMNDASLADR